LYVALLFVLGGFGLSPSVRACACSKAAPGECQGFQPGDVVFTGTVTEIENVTGDFPATAAPNQGNDSAANGSAAPAPITRYHFHIQEKFAGPDGSDIDVFSGGDDGDCGYQFKKGQAYLVFTHQGVDGRIYSTICDGTRPASEGRALIPQLRAMKKGQRIASVFGVLRRADPPFLAPPDDPDDPLPNIALRLRSKDDRFSTHTGPNGIYSFYDVRAGEYNFTANLPVRMELTQKTLTGGLPPFKIPGNACYEYNVDALPTGHIRGSVFGPDRKPVKIASVELYRAGQYADNKPGLWGFQSIKGYFDFDHIGPGEYVMVYNRSNRHDPNSPYPRSFYPGTTNAREAGRITVKDGEQLQKVDINLGDGYATRALKVQVKWEHGRPAGNLTVMAKADDDSGNPAAARITDSIFEFPLLQTSKYTVSAWEDLDPQRAAGGRAANCTIPARIDAPAVAVDGSDDDEKEVTLVFSAVECVKQEGPEPSFQAN
jgi:hypothetical protein